MKRGQGSWKKERTTRRKYSQSDSHKAPAPYMRSRIWVSAFTRNGNKVKGHYRTAPKRR